MNARPKEEPKPLRLVFVLARADNPRLFEELMRFPMGVRRVNRLRVLAYDGLLSQHGVFAAPALSTDGTSPATDAGPTAAAVTNGVFGPSLAE
ncbi:hypothetical protein PEC18_01250 [Paucibacter sp. O1-1]|nr:hypothetical protein [Paucibacter sp. O1-1]MDA3824518.1 hypothetical protein [Paucibacter sp. O1-1]